MIFASDNTGPVHPKIMAAVMAANDGYAMPYGNDDVTRAARDAVRALFEAPDAAVEFVATGSVANALALACLAKPWDGVFCHRIAHVEEDECGAPDFYSGAKTILIDGADAKFSPEALEAAIQQCLARGVHGAQPGPVTITNVTERGTVYTLPEIRALVEVARAHGLPVHLDGARFANACAALGCSPAEMTWKAGVDAVSFGGTKNGCMGVEAVILFDPAKGRELELRRKRGGHLFSKHRYLSAQMAAYVADDLWLEMAQAANARTAQLVQGLARVDGARVCHPAAGNLAFIDLPRAAHARAFAAGAQYYLFGGTVEDGAPEAPLRCRIVCDWAKPAEDVERLLAAWAG
ncbi:beta-eliminating lyase-related protein [Roseicyclus persicicus]|uniref:Low specificity L-threonine aldolase n=1 Tax=Roseicyclus persicicus TaxID=2650661 RepID=A0A7X6GXM3_9RHOB|nr:low specificity L-threonine aldolase [Roseibacterium persicicum]